MKRKIALLQVAVLALLIYACSPSYLGKTYAPTQNVDIYLTSNDIKRPYTTMGNAEVEVMLKSTERTQQDLISLAKSKGADGVILSSTEEVSSTTENTSGYIKKDNKEDRVNSVTSTSTSKTKKIKGTFIKYI